MIYKERLPLKLQPYINKLWYVQANRGHKIEKILPTPYAHFIINLSDGYTLLDSSDLTRSKSFKDGIMSTVQKSPILISNPRIVRNIGAELSPYALPAFCNIPVTSSVTSSSEVGLDVNGLKKQILNTESIDDKLQHLESYLERHLNPIPNPTLKKLNTICAILKQPKCDISAIPQTIGMSHRASLDLIKKFTGLTLKNLHDIYSFDLCLEAIKNNRHDKWTSVVSQLEYFDQPHFIRMFKKYTGFTPSEYRKLLALHGAEYVNFIALDQLYKK